MGTKNSIDLASLVKRCREGDKEAWNELINRVTPIIFSICRKMKLSREESFDIFGQVSYLLLLNLGKLRSADKLLTFVGTMTKREVIAFVHKSRQLWHLRETVMDEMYGSWVKTPDAIYVITRMSEALTKAMAMLPKTDYKLIQALFFDSEARSYKEISEQLGIPSTSIGPTRARCLRKLHRIMKKNGFIF